MDATAITKTELYENTVVCVDKRKVFFALQKNAQSVNLECHGINCLKGVYTIVPDVF